MPISVRLRHPRGITTLELEPENQTIDDLKGVIFSKTEIAPSQQELKYGYPPKPLNGEDPTILSTIPIGKGEQIIVTESPTPAIYAQTPSTSIQNQPATPSVPQTSAPSLSAPSAPIETPVDTTDSVAVQGSEGGFLQLRVVPDDNSCLFSAIDVVFENGSGDTRKLRNGTASQISFSLICLVVVDEIRSDPETYSDIMLGSSREDYILRMLKPDTWGGAIELSAFAKHYQTEISSFDVSTGRCDRFGQDQYGSRCILIYSGIHYDAVTLSPLPAAPPSFHTSVFPVYTEHIMTAAKELVSKLKQRHYYTDTASFDLKCGICGVGLKGEKGAREHAQQTGHVEFGEYTA